MLAKKTLEINPHHPVIKHLLQKVKESDGNLDEEYGEYSDLIFNMAMLNSGFIIETPTDVTSPVDRLLRLGFGLRKDAPIEEIEIDISADEDEEEEVDYDEEGEIEMEEIDYAGEANNEDL